jgi:hypothetical protein
MLNTINMLRFQLNCKVASKFRARSFHNTKGRHPEYSGGATFDQYSAHSPLQHSRHRAEELKSKIFFDHPPIPNRIPKFVLLFFITAVFSTGVRDRFLRRNKKFAREQERYLFRLIVPFVQAMEDIRYTAIEQKNYMITKAISDAIHPGIFENIRWRFHQEDIL